MEIIVKGKIVDSVNITTKKKDGTEWTFKGYLVKVEKKGHIFFADYKDCISKYGKALKQTITVILNVKCVGTSRGYINSFSLKHVYMSNGAEIGSRKEPDEKKKNTTMANKEEEKIIAHDNPVKCGADFLPFD